MKSNILQLNNVSFSYDSLSKPILQSVTFNLYTGWTGIIGANGAGKTTFLKLCINELKIQEGNIFSPQFSIYCEQRTDCCPDKIENFIYSKDKNVIRLRSILEIDEKHITRWDTLSHGERKRFQIGNAVYRESDLLAIDEPTNHLDMEAKEVIKNSLQRYKGIGLIVSHDRDLLDSLCNNCVFIDPPYAVLYKGNYTESKIQHESNIQYNKKMYFKLQKEKKRIQSIIGGRKLIAENSDKRVSKKGIAKKDHDSKARINSAILTGKDGVGGKLVSQMTGRLNHTINEQKKYTIKKEYRTGIEFNTKTSKRNNIFFKEYAKIKLCADKRLLINNLSINTSDKIGLMGKNGSGKTTLIKFILNQINLQPDDVLYIPQEVDIPVTELIRENISKLNDEKLGRLMTLITRLGSNPSQLLESKLYSPGETRKLLFAFGVMNNPQIIIMDEPTNHLDIIAIECLEKALKEITCALLLVSHDRIFLKNTVNVNWNIEKINNDFILIH